MNTLALILGYSVMAGAGIVVAVLCVSLAIEFAVKRFGNYKYAITAILNYRPKK